MKLDKQKGFSMGAERLSTVVAPGHVEQSGII